MKSVSIIIPAWNHLASTIRCLQDLSAALKGSKAPHEVVVVDNGSKDGTAETIARTFKNCVLIPNAENRGFPAAINQGITHGAGDSFLLLNNDTYAFKTGFLDLLVEAVNEKTAAIGDVESLREADFGSSNFKYLAFYCTLIPREAVDKVGLLDERFTPGTWEDVDWCLRAVKAGLEFGVTPVGLKHEASTTMNDLEDAGRKLIEENRAKFLEKWKDDFKEAEAK